MTGPHESTSSLVGAIRQGSQAAQQQLFDRYVPRVRQMVALRLGCPVARLTVDADDVVQDTLLRALRALPAFEQRGDGAFRAWIAKIAENRLRSEARSRRSRKRRVIWRRCADLDLSETLFPSGAPTPSHAAERKELSARIEAAILALPSPYRQAIELRDIAGTDYREMAMALGRTEATCRKIYQRARALLQAKLAGSE